MIIPISGIGKVRMLRAQGPWETKSGGRLEVAVAIPWKELGNVFFDYDQEELQRLAIDIRGFRIYRISGLARGRIGGNEFHRIRTEMAFCIKGLVLWTCQDLEGSKKELVLCPGVGILLPPFIMHTYKVLEDASELEVVANTIFVPDDKRTHDTYSADAFRELAGKP